MANMVKIKLKGFDSLQRRVRKAMNAALDPETLGKMGEEIVRMNQTLIRSGQMPKRIADGGSPKFPPLSERWIDRRKKLKKFNDTGLGYGDRKSNITFTGQLVRAIGYKVFPSAKTINIEIDDSERKPYIMLNGKPSKSKPPSNKELGKYMAEKGLIFIGLTNQMKERTKQILERKLRQMLRTIK